MNTFAAIVSRAGLLRGAKPVFGLLPGLFVLLLFWIAAAPSTSLAACTPAIPSPNNTPLTVTCSGTSGTVGAGSSTTNNQNNVTVIVPDGATINGGANYGIILNNGATISIGTVGAAPGAPTAIVTNAGGTGAGVDTAGFNTVQFASDSTITVGQNGQIVQTSTTGTRLEAINPTGTNNLITNYGLIQNANGPAIWFQDRYMSATAPGAGKAQAIRSTISARSRP